MIVSFDANVDDFRKAILNHGATPCVLSAADGKTYDDEEARVPTVHQTKNS